MNVTHQNNLSDSEPLIHQALSPSVEGKEISVTSAETAQVTNGAPKGPLPDITAYSAIIANRHSSIVNARLNMESHSHVGRLIPFCLGSKPERCKSTINWKECRTGAAEALTTSGIEANSVYIDIDQAYFTAHPTQVIFSDSVSSSILVCARILDDQGQLWRGIAHISPDLVITQAFDQFFAGLRKIPSRHTDVFLMGGLHSKSLYQKVADWVKDNGIKIGYNSRHNPLNITKEQEDDIYHEAYFNLMIKKDGQIDWEGIV